MYARKTESGRAASTAISPTPTRTSPFTASTDKGRTMKDDSGPAFPGLGVSESIDGVQTVTRWANGMSLRDWFAGMALQGFLASPGTSDEIGYPELAVISYQMADAMLAGAQQVNDMTAECWIVWDTVSRKAIDVFYTFEQADEYGEENYPAGWYVQHVMGDWQP